MRFFSLPKIFSFFASIFSRKNIENYGFWPPKTLPKSFPKGFKNDVPKSMRIFIDFCWIFVACCKSRTSKFMRPASVLLVFHTIRLIAFGMQFWSKNPTENLSYHKRKVNLIFIVFVPSAFHTIHFHTKCFHTKQSHNLEHSIQE